MILAGGAAARGDLVVTTPPVVPVGAVESVLGTSRGPRLVVQRAFAPGSYVVVPGDAVASVEEDGGHRVRWLVSRLRPADLLRQGAYRRELGRLVPDVFPPAPPEPAAPGAEAAARQGVAAALAGDPLIAGGDLTVDLCYGVAFLEGWVYTVAARVQATLLARTTPGVWEVRNRLVSDEELRVVVRQALRAHPDAGAAVADFRLDLGRLSVSLRPEAPPAAGAAVRAAAGALLGVRRVDVAPWAPARGA